MERRSSAQQLLRRVQLMSPWQLPTCKASMTQLQHQQQQQQHPQAMACLAVSMTKSLVQRSGRQSTVQMMGRNKLPMLQPMCSEHILLFLCVFASWLVSCCTSAPQHVLPELLNIVGLIHSCRLDSYQSNV